MNLYVLYDEVAKEAGPPFWAKNDGVAMRLFYNLMASEKAPKQEETSVHCIGALNTESLAFIPEAYKLDAIRQLETDVPKEDFEMEEAEMQEAVNASSRV